MASKAMNLFFGLLLVLIVCGYLMWSGIAAPKDITPSVTFETIPAVLNGKEDLTKLTEGLERNGDLPVTVGADEMGREDLLSGY